MTTLWSIVIPTFHRPALLEQAIRSCLGLELPHNSEIEIVVIDNTADGSAAPVCEALHLAQLRYVHEPQSGLANARNRGIEEARGEFIAFLDDDEIAAPDWLLELGKGFAASKADVVFGMVEATFETQPMAHFDYIAGFYKRDVGRPPYSDVSDILNYVGTGNSAYRRKTCFGSGARFDTRFNRFGGEDIQMFRTLKKQGARFAWVPAAKVSEWISVERASLAYLKRRRRTQGEHRVDGLWCSGGWVRAKVPLFMAGGAAQAALHAGLAAALYLTGKRERALEHVVEVQGGLGKIFWMGAATRANYGHVPENATGQS